jgi:hypothetical protein
MPCKICHYNQVKDLDRLLLAGVTPASLSQKYRFSIAELQRHQEHLHQKMALAQKRFQVSLSQGLYCKLNTVMEMVLGVVRGAKQGQDARLLLQAGREFTRIINLMHKMTAKLEFDPEFLYCLTASPEWDLQEDALLPYAFQALSKTRQTLKVNLFEPCPASAPQVPEPALDSKVKVLPPHRENKPGPQSLAHLSGTSAPPAGLPGQEISTGESPPENQRDTSATEARQKRENLALSAKLNNNLNKLCAVKNFFRQSAD